MRHNVIAALCLFLTAVVFSGGLGLVTSLCDDQGYLPFGIWRLPICPVILLAWFAGLMVGLFCALAVRVQKGPVRCLWSTQWSFPTSAVLTAVLLLSPQLLGSWLLLPTFFFDLICLGILLGVRYNDSDYLDEMDRLRTQHFQAS